MADDAKKYSKAAAGKALDLFFTHVAGTFKNKDGKVTNPQTGEVININVTNYVKCKAGKKLSVRSKSH